MNSLPGSSLDLRDRQFSEVDSPAAWRRLGFAVAVGTIGSVGMWLIPVALPVVQLISESPGPTPPCPIRLR